MAARWRSLILLASVAWPLVALAEGESPPAQLEGTRALTLEGDLAEAMISGINRFLLRELEESIPRRADHWKRDTSSPSAYAASVEPNRKQLARMIGLRDGRVEFDDVELIATFSAPALVGRGGNYDIFAVRWPVLDGVHGEGLLLKPTGAAPRAAVVVIPDCEQIPEQLAGLAAGVSAESQIARRLAESGCSVVVPILVNRGNQLSVIAGGKRRSTSSHREILHRAAYQMGRHLIGYEVQKVLAAVDWFALSSPSERLPIGVAGYGEGGLLALYAAGIDPRIAAAGVCGYFDSRQAIWQEPIDRNVFGLLREFGDAEIASLIAPRALIVEACAAPSVTMPPGGDGAPAEWKTPAIGSVRNEIDRARALSAGLQPPASIDLIESGDGTGPFGSEPFLAAFLRRLTDSELAPPGTEPTNLAKRFEPDRRHAQQFKELADFSQRLVDEGPQTRAEFTSKIERNGGVDTFAASVEPYRTYFRDEIIGMFDRPLLPADPRTRLTYDEPEFRGYEVVLDVFPDVVLYGILLVPNDIAPGERRPVVVCQHGLEGRAQFTVEGDYTSYRSFAARLAKRGFVTFSPQHLYRGGDQFRTLQRKANPLKKTLFSVMIAQHRQLLAWLAGLEFVDRDRIAFYGISYGGKSAMRIPAILDGYCLSICSSDFSDWIWRTVSNRFESGYLAHSEYEMFEFDLGSTFNYGEIAALICPRPFMVEDFHRNGLMAERTRGEFARVGLLYENLGIADRTRLAYYEAYLPNLPYVERETFDFLGRQLKRP